MTKPVGVLLKSVVAMTVALLTVPFPMGASADTTVQEQNAAFAPVAISGPAAAVNATTVDAGPSSASLLSTAQSSQVGDNTMDSAQTTESRTGDAYSGSQVTSPVGSVSPTEDVSIQGTNQAVLPLAVSAQAVGASASQIGSGPSAAAVIAPATSSQNGDNTGVSTSDTSARSGDSLAGSQRFSTASSSLPAPPIGRSAQVGWILFVFLGTYVVLALGRRPATVNAITGRPILSDEGLGVKLRIPQGWEGARSHHGVLSLFDPNRSPDGSPENAEVAVVCARRSLGGGDLEGIAMAGPPRDPSYRHIASGYVMLDEAEAFRHEFEADVSGRRLRIVEHFFTRPTNTDEIVRLTAYAPTEERKRYFGSLNDILDTVRAA